MAPAYAGSLWNEALNKRLGTQVIIIPILFILHLKFMKQMIISCKEADLRITMLALLVFSLL